MAEENLSNAEQEKKSQATDADSSLSRQEQASKSQESGELARPGEPQAKSRTDAGAEEETAGAKEMDKK